MSAIQQVIAAFGNYVATPGNTITGGTNIVLDAGGTQASVAMLTSTTAIACWKGIPNACVLTISGTTVTAGATVAVSGSMASGISVTALSSTMALVAFNNSTPALCVNVLNISGTTVTVGTVATLAGAQNLSMYISAINSTQAIVTYRSGSNSISAVVVTTNGSTQSYGTAVAATATSSTSSAVATISSSQAVVTWLEGTAIKARVFNISGTTLTPGTTTTTIETMTTGPSIPVVTISALDSTKTICLFTANNSAVITVRGVVLTASGTGTSAVVSAGSVAEIANPVNTASSPIVSAKSATQAICQYKGSSGTSAMILNISGTTISTNTPFQVSTGAGGPHGIASLSATKSISVTIGVPPGANAKVLTN